MTQRWGSAALLDAELRFRRVRGFRDMPNLMLALDASTENFTHSERGLCRKVPNGPQPAGRFGRGM